MPWPLSVPVVVWSGSWWGGLPELENVKVPPYFGALAVGELTAVALAAPCEPVRAPSGACGEGTVFGAAAGTQPASPSNPIAAPPSTARRLTRPPSVYAHWREVSREPAP